GEARSQGAPPGVAPVIRLAARDPGAGRGRSTGMRAIVVRWALAGLVLAVVTLLIVSSSTAGRTRSPRLPAPAPVPASAPAPAPEGTSSTPAALTLPQTGT